MKIHYFIFLLSLSNSFMLFGTLQDELTKLAQSLNDFAVSLKKSNEGQITQNNNTQETLNNIINEIKNDIVKVFVKETGIMNKNVATLSNGNEELENDLKQLYNSFNKGNLAVQRELNKFTTKWKLEPIAIRNVIDNYSRK